MGSQPAAAAAGPKVITFNELAMILVDFPREVGITPHGQQHSHVPATTGPDRRLRGEISKLRALRNRVRAVRLEFQTEIANTPDREVNPARANLATQLRDRLLPIKGSGGHDLHFPPTWVEWAMADLLEKKATDRHLTSIIMRKENSHKNKQTKPNIGAIADNRELKRSGGLKKALAAQARAADVADISLVRNLNFSSDFAPSAVASPLFEQYLIDSNPLFGLGIVVGEILNGEKDHILKITVLAAATTIYLATGMDVGTTLALLAFFLAVIQYINSARLVWAVKCIGMLATIHLTEKYGSALGAMYHITHNAVAYCVAKPEMMNSLFDTLSAPFRALFSGVQNGVETITTGAAQTVQSLPRAYGTGPFFDPENLRQQLRYLKEDKEIVLVKQKNYPVQCSYNGDKRLLADADQTSAFHGQATLTFHEFKDDDTKCVLTICESAWQGPSSQYVAVLDARDALNLYSMFGQQSSYSVVFNVRRAGVCPKMEDFLVAYQSYKFLNLSGPVTFMEWQALSRKLYAFVAMLVYVWQSLRRLFEPADSSTTEHPSSDDTTLHPHTISTSPNTPLSMVRHFFIEMLVTFVQEVGVSLMPLYWMTLKSLPFSASSTSSTKGNVQISSALMTSSLLLQDRESSSCEPSSGSANEPESAEISSSEPSPKTNPTAKTGSPIASSTPTLTTSKSSSDPSKPQSTASRTEPEEDMANISSKVSRQPKSAPGSTNSSPDVLSAPLTTALSNATTMVSSLGSYLSGTSTSVTSWASRLKSAVCSTNSCQEETPSAASRSKDSPPHASCPERPGPPLQTESSTTFSHPTLRSVRPILPLLSLSLSGLLTICALSSKVMMQFLKLPLRLIRLWWKLSVFLSNTAIMLDTKMQAFAESCHQAQDVLLSLIPQKPCASSSTSQDQTSTPVQSALQVSSDLKPSAEPSTTLDVLSSV